MIKNKINALFNAEQYHGWGKTKRYFEGWYFKVLSADERHAFAFIPGVAMDEQGNRQAFIQVLDGKKRTAAYHQYPFEAFTPQGGKFEVTIEQSFFSQQKIILDVPNVKGTLNFEELTPWSNSWYSPNIMGPFSFLPFMQCYHGILSMNHTIVGQLEINGEIVDFTGGRGYMEKDWGRSFPSAYIWMQTNHFSEPNISIKSSVAKIPYMGISFTGYIAGVWLYDRLLEFTTYNGTKLRRSLVDEQHVNLIYENKKYHLEILAHRQAGTALASPIAGFMDGRVEESMTARVEVQLTHKKSKQVLLEDVGKNAGLEVAGDIPEIMIGGDLISYPLLLT
jgi:hypothetical protein